MKFNANLTRSVYGDFFFPKKIRFRDFKDLFFKIWIFIRIYTKETQNFPNFPNSFLATGRKSATKKHWLMQFSVFFVWRIFATWPGIKRGGYEFRVRKDKM
jgi:hypothetical protein